MNIGSMMRGLLGDSKVGDVKQLEMKTGQVVRGVVLSVSEDGQDAVLQIQGVKVQAKLETPLQQGQATLLQVQPPGEDGMVVMKPLSQSPYTAIPASSIGDVLTSVGLSDTKANREMIQTLQASGVPITKENAALFTGVLMAKPAGVPVEQWIQSATIAFQRGLPMTGESVKGLQQAVFGPPLHQLLSGLGEQLAALISNSQGTAEGGNDGFPSSAVKVQPSVVSQAAAESTSVAVGKEAGTAGAPANSAASPTLQPLLAKLQDVLQQLRGTQLTATAPAPEAAPGSAPAAATPSGGNTPGAAQLPGIPAGVATPPASASAAAPSGIAAGTMPLPPATAAPLGEGAAPSPTSAQAHEDIPWVGRMLKLLGAEHEQQAVRGSANLPAQAAPQGQAAAAGSAPLQGSAAATGLASTPETAPTQAQPATSSVQAQVGATTVPAQHTTASSPQAPVTASTAASVPVSGNTALPVTAQASTATPTNPVQDAIHRMITPLSTQGNQAPGSEVMIRPSVEALNLNQDTLKGLLLHMLESNDVPVALKEAAQQLVQHMTGQQLLLNTDRTAPFAQVTMFIPFTGQDGQETASVHIQSRRGKKGELDASNCRLWFDLDMKNLGTTLIDVQVVDKIVSLKIHNDNTWITSLIEDRRDEISQAIESVGYQLLSLKSEPLPVPTIEQIEGKQSSITTEFTPPTYKGVDMKV